MSLIDSKDSQILFDVEKNAQFALRVFEAYFHTPDATGKTYATFPDFFLVKPHVLDETKFSMPRHEGQSLLTSKLQALERDGYIGVTKYFDEEFGSHRIRFSPFPFSLGDPVVKEQAEYYALLTRFINFTNDNDSIYGNLASPGEDHPEMCALLHDIEVRAAPLNEKLKQYPEAKLLSYDPLWPRAEVRKLLDTLRSNDANGHRVLMEYLRQAMRKQAGVGQKVHVEGQAQDLPQYSLSEVDLPSPNLPGLKQISEGVLELATIRATHLARIGEETRSKALKAEQERIRLEALAIVAARKHILASEEASREALERIEQLRQTRIAEELRLSGLEQEQLENERLAASALAQRLVLAAQASATAEQKHLKEAKLLQQAQADMALPPKAADLSVQGSVAESDDAISEMHTEVRNQDVTTEPALITLDFKSLHKPKALLESGSGVVSRYDPFVYEQRLLEQHKDVVSPTELSTKASAELAEGRRQLRGRNFWSLPFVVQPAMAILFMTLGLIGGRYFLSPQPATLQTAKVQPIIYSAATVNPNSTASSVLTANVVLDKVEGAVLAEPIPLKMSDHLSL